MNYKEKIEKVEAMIKEATELLNKIKAAKEADKDILAEYKDMFGKHDHDLYYVTETGKITCAMNDNDFSEYINHNHRENMNYFNNFFDKTYAEKSLELASFNNKLLAFKWCHDRDYEPDWNNNKESKHFIYYDSCNHSYGHAVYSTISNNTVYFSTEEIAQKCCDWLNSEMKKEDDKDE